MADVSAAEIKDLKTRTGAGIADCKKALVECEGDAEKAVDFLRKKGLAKAAKKAGRIATEGSVTSYIHPGSRVGVLLEVNCETDFVARNDEFQTFTHDVCLQIAAMKPLHVAKEEVPETLLVKEREIRTATALESGKPEKIVGKIVDGQISKWMKEICLLDQLWVKDDKKTIFDLQQELVAKLGEGLEKKSDDFAAEVAKQAGLA